jgi:DNA repair photolyase
VDIIEVQCQSILTRASGYLRQVCSHSLNPYVGCGFGRSGCGVGCYVRHNAWLTKGRDWGGFVDVKSNAPEVYLKTFEAEQRWAHRKEKPFTLFFSSSTDPWQPVEKQYRVTRRLLQIMLAHPPDELILQTHATAMLDDLSLVAELSQQCQLRVHVSIEGDVERLPGLPPPPATVAARIEMLRQLSSAGIFAVACLSPLYPMKNPASFFEQLAEAGANAVVIDHFIEGDGTAEGTRTLKTELPGLMAAVNAESTRLKYRDRIAAIAQSYLPVGISASGFAGHYSKC